MQIDVVCVRIVVIGFNFIEMLMPQLMMIVFACWKGRHSHYEKGEIWVVPLHYVDKLAGEE